MRTKAYTALGVLMLGLSSPVAEVCGVELPKWVRFGLFHSFVISLIFVFLAILTSYALEWGWLAKLTGLKKISARYSTMLVVIAGAIIGAVLAPMVWNAIRPDDINVANAITGDAASGGAPGSATLSTRQINHLVEHWSKLHDESQSLAALRANFKAVHEDYLKTFRHYREMVEDTAHSLDEAHPVFDEIKADSVFSKSQRRSVQQAANPNTPSKPIFAAIADYLRIAFPSDGSADFEFVDANGDRRTLRHDLIVLFRTKDVPNDRKRKHAVALIDGMADKFAEDYTQVENAFNDYEPAKSQLNSGKAQIDEPKDSK